MRKFRNIIISECPPSINDLWLDANKGNLKYWNGTWSNINTSDISWNDIQNKPNIPSEYTLSAATKTRLGGVRACNSIPYLDNNVDSSQLIEAVNGIIKGLISAGVMKS